MIPTEPELFQAMDVTWPAAKVVQNPPWTLRVGDGGGKRVSAASLNANKATDTEIAEAESWMAGHQQPALFMIRVRDSILDSRLNLLGYDVVDPVEVLGRPLSGSLPSTVGTVHQEPSDEMKAVWKLGGIGAARLRVMDRVKGPKAYIDQNRQAVAFAAIHNDLCFVHAVEVHPDYRRQGLGSQIMQTSANWAHEKGAKHIAVLTVRQNTAALNLYRGLGFEGWGGYHYRLKGSAI